MFNVTMTRISGGSNVRTDLVTGVAEFYPSVGERFTMFSNALNDNFDFRMVSTSEVKTISNLGPGSVIIETLNSSYKLEYKT